MKSKTVQATRRTIRLRRWKVEVNVTRHQSGRVKQLGNKPPTKAEYIVIAAAPIDARIMAFALDGGFSATPTAMSENDLPAVEKYTKIMEVSRG